MRRRRAGPGALRHLADPACGGTGGACQLGPAGAISVAELVDRGLRAVGDALDRCEQSRGGLDGQGAQILVGVRSGRPQAERGIRSTGVERVTLRPSEVSAPPVLSLTPPSKSGEKPRTRSGQGAPSGPWSRTKNWVCVCFDSAPSQGTNSLSTGYVPHWVGVASSPPSEPKKCSTNSWKGVCGRSSKVLTRRPVRGSAWIVPSSFTAVPNPLAVSTSRYGAPGFGSPR